MLSPTVRGTPAKRWLVAALLIAAAPSGAHARLQDAGALVEPVLLNTAEIAYPEALRKLTPPPQGQVVVKFVVRVDGAQEEIIHSLMKCDVDNHQCAFRLIHEETGNVVEEVFEMMKRMAEIFGKVNPLMFYELQRYYPQTWKLIKDFKTNFVRKCWSQV